jgi:ribokinase
VSGYVLLEPSAGISATGPRPRRAVLGCSLDERQASDWIQAATSLAPHLLVLNHDEARVLLGGARPAAELSRDLGQRLGAVVVVTHAGGAFAATADEDVEVAIEPVDGAVDTTGAGDAFAAALIAGLGGSEWPPPPTTLRRAVGEAAALASAVTLVEGAQGRVPGEAGVDA